MNGSRFSLQKANYMSRPRFSVLTPIIVLAMGLSGTALLARPGGWGGSSWDRSAWGSSGWRGGERDAASSREGQIEVSRFRIEGDAGLALAHGPIAVVPAGAPASTDEAEGTPPSASDPRYSATFEAAVEDQLVRSGYDAATISPQGGQIAEVRVIRTEAEPAEAPHRPVSGEMSVGVSNHGTSVGMGIYIDGSKPRGALVATRLEARIRDRATGQVLWEGRAEIYTRAGDSKWDDQKVADKLAAALFDGFPTRTGEQRQRR